MNATRFPRLRLPNSKCKDVVAAKAGTGREPFHTRHAMPARIQPGFVDARSISLDRQAQIARIRGKLAIALGSGIQSRQLAVQRASEVGNRAKSSGHV